MSPRRLAFLVLTLAVPVAAQDAYDAAIRRDEGYAPTARVRYVEPSVTLQRSSGGASEEAQPNVPFLPGDRLSTDDSGRAELQFGSGVVVRLDSRSSLEYLSEGGRPTLRLPSGGLYVHARQGVDLAVETGGGVMTLKDQGIYRIDVASGETRLTVLEGSASLDSAGRSVDLQAGERTYARDGAAPKDPQPFDRGDDEFARWDQDREGQTAYARGGESRRYLPREVEPYSDDLDSHGSWSHQGDEGYVWRPSVAADWSPYSDGRWVWTSYGWTWCPYESWGWAPFHYGRWGFRPAFGWYWIPGAVWGPAWVSWAHGGDYVGWCPLGFHDRPVITNINITVINNGFRTSPWIYTRRADILAPRSAQHRVRLSSDVVRTMKVVSSPTVQPSRDFRTVHAIPVGNARARALGGPLPTDGREVGHPTDRRGTGGRVFAPEEQRERNGHGLGAGHPSDRRGLSWEPAREQPRPAPRVFDHTFPPTGERGRDVQTRREVPPTRDTRDRDRGHEWGGAVERPRPRPVPPESWRAREPERQQRSRTFESQNDRPRFHNQEAKPPLVDRGNPHSETRPAPSHRESRARATERAHDKRPDR